MENRVLAGRYRLIAKLGEGGMGSVWRAEHLTLHTDVAVKLIDSQIAESQQATVRFEREAQAAAELRSTHIVQILDYGIDDGTPYIVMELLEGESLGSRLERFGKLPVNETVHILSQVARALARAHQRGIVHRDLKPDNIFIIREDTDEVVKVLDFGIAKKVRDLTASEGMKTHTGMVLGTPYYMSPEQALGHTDIDYRTDIWAFGVIACQCLTGKRPIERETLTALLMAICHDPLPRPSELDTVPAGFDDWFAVAVARDRVVRFDSISTAVAELRKIAEGAVPLAVTATGRTSNLPESSLAPSPAKTTQSSLEETVGPASLTLREGSHRSKRSVLIWAIPTLFLLLGVGLAVQHFILSPPVPASVASHGPLPSVASAKEPTGSESSTAAEREEPSGVPVALGSASASGASSGTPPSPAVRNASRPAPLVSAKASPPQPQAPAREQPAVPSPRHNPVNNTNNAAGF